MITITGLMDESKKLKLDTDLSDKADLNRNRNMAFRDPLRAPIRKLSTDLIRTFRRINEIYYSKKKQVENNDSISQHYDYTPVIGEKLAQRYEITAVLGKGSFGQVVKALDHVTKENVAIKIIKNKKAFQIQSQLEIRILQKINQMDPNGHSFTVQMKNYFNWNEHPCIVFELLSFNLYDLLRNTNFKGVSLSLTRKFVQHLLVALGFLHKLSIIHCDVKPENVLLVEPKRSTVKLIDFGSSCVVGHKMYKYIQSRFYRSPEVLLERQYDSSIDMWSLGCLMIELHTGEPLFPGCNEIDQMNRIIEVLGVPKKSYISESSKSKRYFDLTADGTFKPRIYRDAKKVYDPPATRKLYDLVGGSGCGPGNRRAGEPGHDESSYSLFIDVVSKMLVYDPVDRIKPFEALEHPFFNSECRKVLE